MADYPHPFTQDHCEACNRIIQRSALGMQLAKDCQDCGFDTEQYLQTFHAQSEQAKAFKAKFFPHEI